MTRRDWRSVVVTLGVLLAAGCGGGGHESFLDGIVPTPDVNRTPGPSGDAAIIEFVVPDQSGSTDTSTPAPPSGDKTTFQSSIGPVGTGNAQASLIQFRVLNALGRPARNGTVVDFTVDGPHDARLTVTRATTVDGFVQTVLIAGATPGNATVSAHVENTSLSARSGVVAIARARGPAVAIEFQQLRVPGLLGTSNDQAGTPQTRTQLGVRGSGFAQEVDAVFVVLDANGAAAVDGTIVDFTLFGPNGGESVSPATATSANGFVSTTIFTGTRPGPVEIEARVRGTAIVARAIPLTIAGALNPPGSHLGIAAQCLNVSGGVLFGIEDEISAGLSDQFGNPIPIGSAVSFFTEGGVIDPQGITVDTDPSFARAKLITQQPLPADGRATVLAVTTGQEPFTDLNGNGTWDPGEPFVDLPPEPFLDSNEDGIWEPGEFFIDQNNNGVRDGTPNGIWDSQILISAEIPIIFSGHTVLDVQPTDFAIPAGGSQLFTIHVSDDRGQPLVGGTKVTLSAQNATVFPTEFVIPDTDANTGGQFVGGLTEFTAVLTAAAAQPQAQPSPPATPQPQPPQQASLTVSVSSPIVTKTGTSVACPGGNGDASVTVFGTVGG